MQHYDGNHGDVDYLRTPNTNKDIRVSTWQWKRQV
jgi:hypothetical protein